MDFSTIERLFELNFPCQENKKRPKNTEIIHLSIEIFMNNISIKLQRCNTVNTGCSVKIGSIKEFFDECHVKLCGI